MNFGQAEVEVGSTSFERELTLRRVGSRKDLATEARSYPQSRPLW